MTDEEKETKDIKQGNIHKLMVDVTNQKTGDIILSDDESGENERYVIKYHEIPWERSMQISRKAWTDSEQDKAMYAYLVQVEQIKEMIDEVNGVEADKRFWVSIRFDFVEAVRESMFGDSPLMPSADPGELKNYIGVLKMLMPDGTDTNEMLKNIQEMANRQHPQSSSTNGQTP